MSEDPEVPPSTPVETPPPEPPAPREPFWGYSDLALFIGLAFPCLLVSVGIVKIAIAVFHLPDSTGALAAVVSQALFYLLLFLALRLMFLAQYGQPFWRSLGWKRARLPDVTIMLLGAGAAVGIALTSALLRTPDTPNQMTEMMRDPKSLILMAIFGITMAPLCEELAFRGFLQPLIVRSLGVLAGIVIPGIAFGLLHFHEYGNSWRHAVVISLAGIAFGCMRQFTGSTRAAALMHAAYNGFLFLALFLQRKDLPHLW